MATGVWGSSGSVIDLLRKAPSRFELLQAVRLLEMAANAAETGPDAGSGRPRRIVGFRGPLDGAFAASEVRRLIDGNPTVLEVNVLGLNGPQGPLPAALGRRILDMMRSGDTQARDFLDIFNNRLVALLISHLRAENPALQSGPADRSRQAAFLFSLLGLGSSGIRHTLRPPPQPRIHGLSRSLLKYAGLLNRRPKSLHSVERLIGGFFGVPVRGRSFVGHWSPLPRNGQAMLGGAGRGARLGSAPIGRRVWLQDGAIGLAVGPMSRDRFLELLPGTPGHDRLRALLRLGLSDVIDVECRLSVTASDAPRARLGGDGATRLGLTSWVGTQPMVRDGEIRLLLRLDREPSAMSPATERAAA
jgi:type VI secretion system protein ImpH